MKYLIILTALLAGCSTTKVCSTPEDFQAIYRDINVCDVGD